MDEELIQKIGQVLTLVGEALNSNSKILLGLSQVIQEHDLQVRGLRCTLEDTQGKLSLAMGRLADAVESASLRVTAM